MPPLYLQETPSAGSRRLHPSEDVHDAPPASWGVLTPLVCAPFSEKCSHKLFPRSRCVTRCRQRPKTRVASACLKRQVFAHKRFMRWVANLDGPSHKTMLGRQRGPGGGMRLLDSVLGRRNRLPHSAVSKPPAFSYHVSRLRTLAFTERIARPEARRRFDQQVQRH
jgi:hypothetical protein